MLSPTKLLQRRTSDRLGSWLLLYQVVLQRVYLRALFCVVRSVAMVIGKRGRPDVVMLGRVRVEDVHGAIHLGGR